MDPRFDGLDDKSTGGLEVTKPRDPKGLRQGLNIPSLAHAGKVFQSLKETFYFPHAGKVFRSPERDLVFLQRADLSGMEDCKRSLSIVWKA
jgi:hypothetical protein